MKNFNKFLSEAENIKQTSRVSDDVMTVFGRNNPPHLGHKLVLDKAASKAKEIGADKAFYTSRSQDPKKNPLPYDLKLDHLKRMFPQHANSFDSDPDVKTILQAASKAGSRGYRNFHFMGGSDRRQGMEDLLRKYNGQLYNFDNIYSHSAGEREEDPNDPISGLSASKMRNFASKGDFESFAGGLPIGENYTLQDAQELFNALRSFMVKNESYEVDYRSYKDYIREQYKEGKLYKVGDVVESLSSGLVGRVHRCGTNHLICVTDDGIMFKNFVYDVNLL